jgi:tetratricopeptide (TPR) repeat protein
MEKNFDKIEQYIKGQMSPTEKAAFEQEAATNNALAKELAIKRLELESYELMVENSLKSRMSDWDKKRKALDAADTKPAYLKIVQSNAFRWATAASVALLAIFLYQNNKPTTTIQPTIVDKDTTSIPAIIPKSTIDTTIKTEIAIEKPIKTDKKAPQINNTPPPQYIPPTLPADNPNERLAMVEDYAYEPDYEVTSRTTDTQDSILKAALSFLKNKEYGKAQPLLNSIKEDILAQYYLGYTYIKTGQFDKAIPLFEQLAKNAKFNLKDETSWYLALAYLGANRRAEAIALLTKIKADTEHSFYKSSVELLRKLKK